MYAHWARLNVVYNRWVPSGASQYVKVEKLTAVSRNN